MSVRAKFVVTEIKRHQGSRQIEEKGVTKWQSVEVRTVCLVPVSSGSDENKQFFNSSPSGRIELGCANLEAAEAFELGKEYYIDFTPAA